MRGGTIYRSNPPLFGKVWRGRKVMDQVTGKWTYENLLVTDPFGYRVDGTVPDNVDLPDEKLEGVVRRSDQW